jgi:hypothetical protein
MDNQRTQPQDESLKNNDQPLEGERGSSSGTQHQESSNNTQHGEGENNSERRHVSAAQLDALISSPTNAVHARHHQGLHGQHLADTGTNISYEGATAPGGGGSVGTGQASGQSATGSSITSTDADLTVSGAHHPHTSQQGADDRGSHTGEGNPLQKQHDDELDRDTVGTP